MNTEKIKNHIFISIFILFCSLSQAAETMSPPTIPTLLKTEKSINKYVRESSIPAIIFTNNESSQDVYPTQISKDLTNLFSPNISLLKDIQSTQNNLQKNIKIYSSEYLQQLKNKKHHLGNIYH